MENDKQRIPVIVDTDMGPDDWAAILFLALSPEISLLAVTIVGTGEAHGPRGARNCATLLSAAGHAEVPIGIGRPRPLSGNNAFPALMRWVVDRFLFVPPPPPSAGDPRRMAIGDDAVELLRRPIRGEERQVTGLARGPRTTLAE